MATNVAIVRHRHLNTPSHRNAQARHITTNGMQRPDLNVLTSTTLNGAQRTITESITSA